MKQRCKNCLFFSDEDEKGVEDCAGERTGLCHRYPPSLRDSIACCDYTHDRDADMYFNHCNRICVMINDWCGEWKPRKKQEEPK